MTPDSKTQGPGGKRIIRLLRREFRTVGLRCSPFQADKSWLAKILDMLRSELYPELWTDIAYTLYADDDYVYLLNVLLDDERVLNKVMFGSDFYVVDDAQLEERSRSVRIRLADDGRPLHYEEWLTDLVDARIVIASVGDMF